VSVKLLSLNNECDIRELFVVHILTDVTQDLVLAIWLGDELWTGISVKYINIFQVVLSITTSYYKQSAVN
jgi:hypothetical protein